ncbi:hypothetical protein BD779DRAFT_1679950 [Infundibulicybe gibba]|nr:hypothetical protein BD779DRAFT_1679950 [Infundibulicybe gibba]
MAGDDPSGSVIGVNGSGGDDVPIRPRTPVPVQPAVLQTDATHPSIPSLYVSEGPWDGQAVLKKSSNNWPAWKERMVDVLTLSKGMNCYLTGTVPRPDPVREPRATYNYELNDESVRAYIRTKLSPEELAHVKQCQSSKEVWSILKDRHERQGPIAQILLMQEAFNIRYSHSVPFAETIACIADINDRIWNMGAPMRERFHVILHLLALAPPQMHNVRDAITNGLSTATHEHPYAVQQIVARIEMEQKVLASDGNAPGDALMVDGTSKTPRKPMTCSNCHRSHHEARFCIKPNGGMAGKTVAEAQAAARTERGLPPKKAPSSASSSTTAPATPAASTFDIMRDAKGRAYAVDTSSGQAYFLQPDRPALPPAPAAEAHFMAMETDDIETLVSPLVANSMTNADYAEVAWLATQDDVSTSVDWEAYSSGPADFSVWLTSPIANGARKVPISPDSAPFLIDSACTTHISPERADLFSLSPVNNRSVLGHVTS